MTMITTFVCGLQPPSIHPTTPAKVDIGFRGKTHDTAQPRTQLEARQAEWCRRIYTYTKPCYNHWIARLKLQKKCKHNGLTAIIIISRQAGRQATNHMQSKHNHPWWYTYIFVFTAKSRTPPPSSSPTSILSTHLFATYSLPRRMARNEWIPMPAMTTRHPWTPASSWLIKNSKNRESNNSTDSSSPAHQQKIITFGSPINLRRMRSNCNCTSESHTYMPVCVQSVSCKIYAIDLVKSNPA